MNLLNVRAEFTRYSSIGICGSCKAPLAHNGTNRTGSPFMCITILPSIKGSYSRWCLECARRLHIELGDAIRDHKIVELNQKG